MNPAAYSSTTPGATLSGRDLARQRRAALASRGRTALVKTASTVSRPTSAPAQGLSSGSGCSCGTGQSCGGACQSAAKPVPAGCLTRAAGTAAASGRDVARARREALARNGKSGLAAAATTQARPSGRVRTRPTRADLPAIDTSHTQQGQRVTGLPTQRGARVTGNEAGTCRSITGDEYLGVEDLDRFCAERPAAETIERVSVRRDEKRGVTGPSMGADTRVTGQETGLCRSVTGTQYLAPLDRELCVAHPPSHPHKVSVMSSRGQQTVTGTSVGQGRQKVTGTEAGASRSLSGTQYAVARQGRSGLAEAGWRVQALTGDVPGVGGGDITGDERGACEPVTGTAYTGPDNLHASCTVSSRWLRRFPEAVVEPPVAAPADFSIQTPARQADSRRQQDITGLPSQAEDRITGPGNKAGGLITGTPEFRHRGSQVAAWAAPGRSDAPIEVAASPQAGRLTGEGSQRGVRITGDAWSSAGRVTGTEGASSSTRNPSQRGEPRGAGVDARALRDMPRPEIKPSRVTGSSGNTERGATVTLSGGARG